MTAFFPRESSLEGLPPCWNTWWGVNQKRVEWEEENWTFTWWYSYLQKYLFLHWLEAEILLSCRHVPTGFFVVGLGFYFVWGGWGFLCVFLLLWVFFFLFFSWHPISKCVKKLGYFLHTWISLIDWGMVHVSRVGWMAWKVLVEVEDNVETPALWLFFEAESVVILGSVMLK